MTTQSARLPVAVVTGASGGIGSGLSLALLDQGYEVFSVGRSHPSDDRLRTVDCNFASKDDLLNLESVWPGDVAVLVNCAGAITAFNGWQTESIDDVEQAFRINYTAALVCAQLAATSMRPRRSGRIINVCSIYGGLAAGAVATYGASKAAMMALTRSMALDLAPFGITVNAISPGNIDTQMTRGAGAAYVEEVVSRTPAGRLGSVSEVVHSMQFLLENSFVTGADIVLDGGISLVGG